MSPESKNIHSPQKYRNVVALLRLLLSTCGGLDNNYTKCIIVCLVMMPGHTRFSPQPHPHPQQEHVLLLDNTARDGSICRRFLPLQPIRIRIVKKVPVLLTMYYHTGSEQCRNLSGTVSTWCVLQLGRILIIPACYWRKAAVVHLVRR